MKHGDLIRRTSKWVQVQRAHGWREPLVHYAYQEYPGVCIVLCDEHWPRGCEVGNSCPCGRYDENSWEPIPFEKLYDEGTDK